MDTLGDKDHSSGDPGSTRGAGCVGALVAGGLGFIMGGVLETAGLEGTFGRPANQMQTLRLRWALIL